MMRAFIDSILRGHSEPEIDPTFDDGLAAQRAQDAVLRSVSARAWQEVGGD